MLRCTTPAGALMLLLSTAACSSGSVPIPANPACESSLDCVVGSCVDGVCRDVGLCAVANPLGSCPPGRLCSFGVCTTGEAWCDCPAGQGCSGGSCVPAEDGNGDPINRCSLANQDGLCTADGELCVAGRCVPCSASAACSAENTAGCCPAGAACAGGYCLPIDDRPCGPANLTGLCPPAHVCTGAGACQQVGCSPAHPFGACGVDQVCEDGSCETLPCSTDHPAGACPSGSFCSGGGECIAYGTCLVAQDCLYNQYCSANRSCIAVNTCAVDDDCPLHHVCDATRCERDYTCAGDGDCLATEHCLSSGSCGAAGVCEIDLDCNAAERCAAAGHCMPADECFDDRDCDAAQFCGQDSHCRADGTCGVDGDCPPGHACGAGGCAPSGTLCDSNAPPDCPGGELCSSAGSCIKVGECVTGADCPPQFGCVDDACVPQEPCADDGACEVADFCSLEAGCVPDGRCAVGPDCPDGEFCNAQFSCEPGGCGSTEFSTTLVPPNMLIVLDRSGSMAGCDGDSTWRWTEAVQAITEVTADHQSKVRFGLATFPQMCAGSSDTCNTCPNTSNGCDNNCNGTGNCQAGVVNVPVAAGTRDAIINHLTSDFPGGNTPTGPTLRNIAANQEQYGLPDPNDDTPRNNYVLLITDGEPNCDGGSGEGGKVSGAIESLRASSTTVGTFVVGFAFSAPSATLNCNAVFGGTSRCGAAVTAGTCSGTGATRTCSCSVAPFCNDGTCNGGETATTCAVDCQTPRPLGARCTGDADCTTGGWGDAECENGICSKCTRNDECSTGSCARPSGCAHYYCTSGTGSRTGCDVQDSAIPDGPTCYYEANNAASLSAAFDDIAGQIASCSYALGQEPPDVTKLYVYFEDAAQQLTRLDRDLSRTGNWDFDSPTQISFFGAQCDAIKAGTVTVRVFYGCPDVGG